jgi:hypothetical protein
VTTFTPYIESGDFGKLPGSPLTDADLKTIAPISREMAEAAGLRRVDSATGARLMGRNGAGDYSGIVFPYFWPGEADVHEYRLRRDRPDLRYDAQGKPREDGKYLSPPGAPNRLYFPPGTDPSPPVHARLVAGGLRRESADVPV